MQPGYAVSRLVGAWCLATLLGCGDAGSGSYAHDNEPIGTVREIYDGVLTPELAVNTFRNIHRLFPSRVIPPSTDPAPLPADSVPLTNVIVSTDSAVVDLDAYLDFNRVTGLHVLHDGRIVLERYRMGNSPGTRWMSMSIAKSITSTLIGAAVRDGFITSLDDPVTRYVPSVGETAWDGVTVRHVLQMTSGLRWNETYTDPTSDRRQLLEAQIAQEPGGALAVMRGLPRAASPGAFNNYSTGETQVAGEVLRGALGGRSLSAYLFEQVWQPAGMQAAATWWLESPEGIEIGGSGFSAVLRDYGRFGLFVLNDGVIEGASVLPAGWVREATSPFTLAGGERVDYSYFWWPGTSESARRDGAFSAEGIHGQFLYLNPAVRGVIVVWSAQPRPLGGAVVDDWAFFGAVADSLRRR
jgi:CubicO group peptidase (beta-lactamase class C family)